MTDTSPPAEYHEGPQSGEDGARPRLGLALFIISLAQLMVVLDATIVNVALPHIQTSLSLGSSTLEWVITAYSLAFGGLLLLGGRTGDILGRRRVFIGGITLFTVASLVGGFATHSWWLLTCRALQGVGAAFAAPTALALINTTFPAGPKRNRAMGVYAAMSGAGGAVGLLAGGVLTTYLSWRWVLFVNVPMGAIIVLVAPHVLRESARRRARFDLPGALTVTLGISLLVYGFSHASADQNGTSHWGEPATIGSLAAGAVLLIAFVLLELRTEDGLLPLQAFSDRNRVGAYLIMLCFGAAMFGMFFFVTIYMQTVWSYSAMRTGLAYLPLSLGIAVLSGITARLVDVVAPRVLLLAGPAVAAAGMFWMSRLTDHSHYAGGLLGTMLVTTVGFGLTFVPLTLAATSGFPPEEAGIGAGLLNTSQQIGGSIGLSVLGTIAWSRVGESIKDQLRAGPGAGGGAHRGPLPTAIRNHAFTEGFTRGLAVGAAVLAAAFVISAVTVRLSPQGRDDLVSGGEAPAVHAG